MAKCESMKLELLAHPEVQAWLQSLWSELKRSMLDGGGRPRQRAARAASTTDWPGPAPAWPPTPTCKRKVDDWVERLAGHVVENYKGEVADIIASTVERWDAADTSRRIELQVGRDLQFIRINGTIVGGLAGLAIYTVSQLIT